MRQYNDLVAALGWVMGIVMAVILGCFMGHCAHADSAHHHMPPCPVPKAPVVQLNTTNVVNQYSYTTVESPADEQTHLAAHLGAAFAIQTVAYGINRQIGMSKLNAETLGFIETLAIGILYKSSEHAQKSDILKATQENALGSGLAILTHVTFSF